MRRRTLVVTLCVALMACATATVGGAAGAKVVPALPLHGIVVGIDPGHNGDNYTDPAYINHLVWNGRAWETCDTTGTATDSGYTESLYNCSL